MKRQTTFFALALLWLFNNLNAQNYTDSLTIALQEIYQTSQLLGFAIAIVDNEKILYQQAFGYADLDKKTPYTPQSIQGIGSVSKTVIGMALAKTIEQGKLSMETEINDLLPFEIIHPYFPNTPITVRQLAEHTSGILDSKHYAKSYLLEETNLLQRSDLDKGFKKYIQRLNQHERLSLGIFCERILSKKGQWYSKKNFAKQAPGSQKSYSNLGAALTAYLIELATKMSFEEYTQKYIFLPLQMTQSAWSPSKVNADLLATTYFPNGHFAPKYSLVTYPDGGLQSSVAELSSFLIEVIKGFSGEGILMSQEAYQLMLPGDENDYRAFWGINEMSKNIGHSGGDPGIATELSFNAESGIGRILMTNVGAEDNELLCEQFQRVWKTILHYEQLLESESYVEN
ncbi:MAG: serine hydrolase domain-containing protein [Bacteroidota bacterium]